MQLAGFFFATAGLLIPVVLLVGGNVFFCGELICQIRSLISQASFYH